MKRALAGILLMAGVAAGCAPAGDEQVPTLRATSLSTGEVFGPEMLVWAEGDTRPAISRLIADPADGVWGGQDGELFHFRVRKDATYGRITYGRPDPAAIWIGDLVRLSEERLAGRVITRHLVRMGADGKVTNLGPARSPGGVPFDFPDIRGGELHLHDRQGACYKLGKDGKGFLPVDEFGSGSATHPGQGAADQAKFEAATGGRVTAWVVLAGDGNSYALVDREQLFAFDGSTGRFTLLDHPGVEPIGSVTGQIVGRSGGALVVVDISGQKVREFQLEQQWPLVFQGLDGWFYQLPYQAVNLLSGETRPLEITAIGGAVNHLVSLGSDQMVGGTDHGGTIFAFHAATGRIHLWGRPIPELGQESGEEVAPITGLAVGKDGYIYAAIGTGARGHRESHLVRMDATGRVLTKTRLPEPLQGLITGADGRIYGAGFARVVVLPPDGAVR